MYNRAKKVLMNLVLPPRDHILSNAYAKSTKWNEVLKVSR